MSTIKPVPKPQDQFDAVKLDQMVEPLTIIVERVRGSQRSRVPLPESQDGISPAGTGYTKQDILGFETWMVKEWTGGGSFIFNVNDSSNPPITMRWTAGYPLEKYPELVPPPMRATVVPAPMMSTPTPQVFPMAAFPNGLPNVPTMHAPVNQVPQMGYAPQPYAPQPIYPQNWNSAQQADFDRRNLEAKLLEVEAARFKDREAQLAREYESKLAMQRADTERQLEGLKTLIASQNNNRPSPEFEAMKAENARLAAQADADRRERDADKRDQAMRDMIRASEERAQRAADAIQAQFAQMMTLVQAQSANKGPDPMLAMMMEQTRVQAEAQKEIARENRASLERMQGLIMPPREMIAMMKEASSGADQVTRQVTSAMGDVLGFQSRVMEAAMASQGTGGKTVVDIVDGAIERASGLAEKYALAKSHEARAASQAQAQVAQAQAQAVTAQAQSEIVRARTAAGVPEPAKPTVVHTPPPPKQEKQLGAAATAPQPQPQPQNANTEPRRSVSGSPARTDLEWFTEQAMPDVKSLRLQVTRLIESLSMHPPRMKDGKPDGVEAEQCAGWILQAMAFAIQHNIKIPALVELLAEKRYADFMDVLLPDAPQPYRDHVIKLVVAELEGDDDDDGGEGDDRGVGQAHDDASAEQH